jgi:hypothetical protein
MAQTDVVGWLADFAQRHNTQKAVRWLSETPRLFANNPVRGRHMPTGSLFFFGPPKHIFRLSSSSFHFQSKCLLQLTSLHHMFNSAFSQSRRLIFSAY